jgi:mono/diheme cytochrome c family protein
LKWFLRVCLLVALASPISVEAAASAYEKEIKPVLKERCYACHGALKQKAGLRVDTVAFIKEANVIASGDPEKSELVQRIRSNDEEERMPPEGHALTQVQVKAITDWITAGALAPEGERPEDDPLEHWAFQKIERPDIPKVDGISHPVDALLAAKQKDRGVIPVAAVNRKLAIRRLYLDLIGLPPTRGQLEDNRPWEAIVDELLASPQHGERWARHWMDVWRYSDWYGLGAQLRYSQRHLWHWRDWIVESLNEDAGYDSMVRAMLAGDELFPDNPDQVRATGFLARNYFLFNRTTWLDNTIEHTGKAFLGLTINCAKCHDHKYDPISAVDYYRFRAIFEPHQVRLDPLPGDADLDKNGLPRVFDDNLEAVTYVHQRGDEKKPDKETKIDPQVPEFLSAFASPIKKIKLPLPAYAPGSIKWVQEAQLEAAKKRVEKATAELAKAETTTEEAASQMDLAKLKLEAARAEQKSVEATIAADQFRFANPGKSNEDLFRTAAKTQVAAVLARSKVERLGTDAKKKKAAREAKKKAEERLAQLDKGKVEYDSLRVTRKALETPAHKFTDYPSVFPDKSTGRRTMLANWIVSPENPLTARVAVNHVWMRHFGLPLVDSVFDFGRQAKEPEQLALLDLLAVEFMESGWSFRHLHRLIVTSEAWRRDSSTAKVDSRTREADPENRFYWRMNPRRMEAQVVRDSLLHLSGELDLTMGGSSVDPDGETKRRSIYFNHSPEKRSLFLSTFDDADLLQCYRRSESVVPQQALALSNSELAFEAAGRIAGKWGAEKDSSALITELFLQILGRSPDEEEIGECVAFLSNFPSGQGQRARSQLVHALLNHNDFITIR